MILSTQPLLTIAIPTWNRAPFLATLLNILQSQRINDGAGKVEILVCDNHSTDNTQDVIALHQRADAEIRHIRHDENLGSDHNIAMCHNLAQGRYVWILGDDDIPLGGTVARILAELDNGELGLLFLRSFGFTANPVAELPRSTNNKTQIFSSIEQFLNRVGSSLTLISAVIYNRSCIADIDARKYCGSNLVQVSLYLGAAQRSHRFAYFNSYLLAYRKNNGRPYDFSKVFVENMHQILLEWQDRGLPLRARHALERRMLIQYFPQGAVVLRRDPDIDVLPARARFRDAYHEYAVYWIMVEPILSLPKIIALPWGLICVAIGRALSGDLIRGLYYLRNKLS